MGRPPRGGGAQAAPLPSQGGARGPAGPREAAPGRRVEEPPEPGAGGAGRGHAGEPGITSAGVDYGALRYVLGRIMEQAAVKSRGADAVIEFPAGARVWIRKSILEAAGLL